MGRRGIMRGRRLRMFMRICEKGKGERGKKGNKKRK